MATERHGAAHRITAWRPVSGWTSSQGPIVSALNLGEGDWQHRLEVTKHSAAPGYSVSLDFTRDVNRGGIHTEQYSAGPFRTQRYAEIAGEALTNRVEAGRKAADQYRTGSYHESAAEIRANR
jgi:hypothetical protein